MVEVFYEDIESLNLKSQFYTDWLSNLCVYHKLTLGDVNLIFCSDSFLLEMNKSHLNHNYYTDIITFNYNDEAISGDLFISTDRIKENALTYNASFITELNRVVAHGTLHLIGFNDKSDSESKEMTIQENKALDLIVSRETIK